MIKLNQSLKPTKRKIRQPLEINGSNTLYQYNFITIDYISKTTSKDYKEQKFKIVEIDNSKKTIKIKGMWIQISYLMKITVSISGNYKGRCFP